MKKLLTGILALTLVFSLTACGENKDNKDDKKEETKQTEVSKETDPKEAAEETVKDFMDAFCELDTKEMAKYIDGELPEEFSDFNFDAVKEETINSLPEELGAYKTQFGDMFDSLIDKMLATINYDILSVEEDGDNMIAKVDITMADFNALEDALNNALSTDFSAKFVEIAEEAMANGDLTDDSTEQEVIEYLLPKAIDAIGDILEKEIDSLERTTEEAEFTLTEVDGKWLIDADSTEF